MKRLLSAALCLLAAVVSAQDKPLRGLMVTGGCCHDYATQKTLLADGIKARTAIEFDFAGDNPEQVKEKLTKPDWAAPYDVIVYNFCDANQKDSAYIQGVIDQHRVNGKGAVMVHCAMHSFHWAQGTAKTDFANKEWVKLIGVGSPGHGPKLPITVKAQADAASHPVMKDFPADWVTGNDELYATPYIAPTTKVLAMGSNGKEKDAAVIWVHEVDKAKVFSISIGHTNESMGHKNYLDVTTKGLLWTCGRLK